MSIGAALSLRGLLCMIPPMHRPASPRRHGSQQFFVTALAAVLLLVGVVPALHHHEDAATGEAHCHESALQAPTHLEPQALEHHEACGLCAKTSSSAHLEWPLATLVDELVADHRSDGLRILPPEPPGRHGASRAPPWTGPDLA